MSDVWKAALAATVGALVIILAVAAFAQGSQSQCGPTETVTLLLYEQYGEEPQFIGLTNGGALVIFVGPTGSFTAAMAPVPGTLCIVSSGEGWRAKDGPEQQNIPQQQPDDTTRKRDT